MRSRHALYKSAVPVLLLLFSLACGKSSNQDTSATQPAASSDSSAASSFQPMAAAETGVGEEHLGLRADRIAHRPRRKSKLTHFRPPGIMVERAFALSMPL